MENFSVDPRSLTKFRHLTVSPMFAYEWHVIPPAYDLYYAKPPKNQELKDLSTDPQSYPYGQYHSITNLIPYQEKKVHLFCNGKSNAIGYINSEFTAHDIANRENIQHIPKLILKNRYRHDCYDTFSPFNSF